MENKGTGRKIGGSKRDGNGHMGRGIELMRRIT